MKISGQNITKLRLIIAQKISYRFNHHQDESNNLTVNLTAGVEKNHCCGKILIDGGDFLAKIRIDNFSGDTVTVFFDEDSKTVDEDENVTFDSLEKGTHRLRIHRTRVPLETETEHEARNKSLTEELQGQDKSLHIPLDLEAMLRLDSSKSVITVKSDITAKEGRGLDVIFASYSLSVTGAKTETEKKSFASSAVKKRFLSHHLKSMFFPIGLGGAIIFIVALVSLFFAITGNPINIGGTVFTLPWALALTAVAMAIGVYFAVCIANILKTAKRLDCDSK